MADAKKFMAEEIVAPRLRSSMAGIPDDCCEKPLPIVVAALFEANRIVPTGRQ